jgi:hypothetical protein
MNPNSNQPYQQQPQPGASPYPGTAGPAQPMPNYASDPGAILQANGMPVPQPVPMPQPPVNAGAQTPQAQPNYQAQQVVPTQPYAPPQAQSIPTTSYSQPATGPVTQGQGFGSDGNQGMPGTKPVVNNPNSTQNMLQIAEIRDGIVIMSDGSYRSVVMVNSINFDLMSRAEQEAVEYNYQSFLNSLYFPMQIFIRSQKVDMTPYVDKLDRIRAEHDNMLLSLLMDDYVGYIEALAQQTNIMDKKFYIVIPFFPHVDVQKSINQSKKFVTGFSALFGSKEQKVVINEDDLRKAKDELRNRVQTVLDGLQQCSIQSLPLDTQELIELYYDTYNPDTATRQQLKNFNSMMDVDVVGKGEGVAAQPNLDRELS